MDCVFKEMHLTNKSINVEKYTNAIFYSYMTKIVKCIVVELNVQKPLNTIE